MRGPASMTVPSLSALAAQGFTRVPVVRRLLADLETPLGAYLRFKAPGTFLFESVQGGEKWGRYSIIGTPAETRITVRATAIEVRRGNAVSERHEMADPLAFVEEFARRERVWPHPQLGMFAGG